MGIGKIVNGFVISCMNLSIFGFLAKNAVPSLSPRTNSCPSIKLCNTLYTKRLQGYKWALKNILHRKIIN